MSTSEIGRGLNHSGLIVVLAALTMIGALGVDLYLPSFGAIEAAFGTTPVVVQQTLSVYMAANAVAVLFAGTLSDSIGRRRLVLAALLLFAAASVIAVLAPNVGTLIFARVLQGLAGGVATVLARAIVQDRFDGAEATRAMALVMLVFGVGPAIAPILGGWVQAALGWQANFVLLAVYAAVLWAVCQWGLRESLATDRRAPLSLRPIVAGYLRALRNRPFMLRAGGLGLAFIGLSLHISSASAYVVGILGLDETSFGWLFIPMVGGTMIGSLIAERLARRVANTRIVAWGFACMLLGALAGVMYTSVFEPRIPYAIIPLAVYALGLGVASPAMTVQTLDLLPGTQGLASSLMSFVQMLVFASMAGLVAPLVFHSAQALTLTHFIGVAIGGVLWLLSGGSTSARRSGPKERRVGLTAADPL